MTDLLIGAGKSILDWQSRQLQPIDPLYESYKSKTGDVKWRRRPMPPGLTHHEQSALRKVRKRAHFLDEGFSKGGKRLYPTSLMVKWQRLMVKTGILVHGRHSILEVTGEVRDILLCYSLIMRKASYGMWDSSDYAMAANAPTLPVIGSAVASAVKPNSRNAMLFEDFLIRQTYARQKKAAAPKEDSQTPAKPVPAPPPGKFDESIGQVDTDRAPDRRPTVKTTSANVLMVQGVGDGGDGEEEAPSAMVVEGKLETARAGLSPSTGKSQQYQD